MTRKSIRVSIALAAAVLASMPLLVGCKGGELSKQEVQQIQQGPPAEMPPQAKAAMQRGMQAPPPPPPGQAGP